MVMQSGQMSCRFFTVYLPFEIRPSIGFPERRRCAKPMNAISLKNR